MSVPANQPNRYVYAGDGSSTSFAVSSVFENAADLLVYTWDTVALTFALKTLITDYTVSGGNDSTGAVIFNSAPATGTDVIIVIAPVISQTQNISTGGVLPPSQYLYGLDFLTLIARRMNELFTRSICKQDYDISTFDPHLPAGMVPGDMFAVNAAGTSFAGGFPSAAARSLMLLGFDINGLPVAVLPSAGGGVVTVRLPVFASDAAYVAAYGAPIAGSEYYSSATSQIRLYNGSAWVNVPTGTVPVSSGGTGVTALPTTASASAFAAWDANSNLSANNFLNGFATTATASTTTTLSVGSAAIQVFTGTSPQNCQLPVASTLRLGQQFTIINLSSNVINLRSSGGNTLQSLAANTQAVAICILTSGTGTASWTWYYGPAQSGILSIAQGGTGAATATAAFLALAPSSPVAGQVIAWNGSAWVSQTVQAGTKNYITFNNFENNSTTGWSLAHSAMTSLVPTSVASAATPFDSTHGGSAASGNLSQAIVSSGQLAGSYSLSVASSAATTAGDMLISQAYTLDLEDQAKVLTGKFYYKAQLNPGNANWSGTSANSFAVWIYDVTNAAWIQPAGTWGMTQSSGVGYCTFTWQTPSNMSQFQVAIINLNATAGATTVYFDDFTCGPQTAPLGAAVTDWQSYTPTFVGFGTVSGVAAYWRRVGDSMQIQAYWVSGTATGVAATVTLPNGTVDATKIGANNNNVVGYWSADTGVAGAPAVIADNGAALLNFGLRTGAAAGMAKALGNAISSNGQNMSLFATVPIAGWSSNVQMSNDTDTRVVAFCANLTRSGAAVSCADLASATANVIFNAASVDFDTHAAYNPSTGNYTCPVTGIYEMNIYVEIAGTGGSQLGIQFWKNGVSTNNIGSDLRGTSTIGGVSTGLINCKAGDTLSTRITCNPTSPAFGGNGSPYLTIKRLTGPSVVAATETVSAKYYSSGSTTSTTSAPINYDTKVYDTHGAVTTGAGWKFTAPTSGRYALTTFNNSASGTNSTFLAVYKNGVKYESICYSSAVQTFLLWGATQIQLLAGDTIDLRCTTSTVVSGNATQNADTASHIEINKVGN